MKINAPFTAGHFSAIKVEQEYQLIKEAIRLSDQSVRILFDQAADALYVMDVDGRFYDVNQQACRELGYTRAELLSMRVDDMDKAYRTRAVEKEFWDKLPRNKRVTFEVEHTRRDGTTFPVEVHQTMIEPLGSGLSLIFAVARNITARKQVEDELARHRDHLQELVREQTVEIEATNQKLRQEIEKRKNAQEALQEALEVLNAMKKQVEAENVYLRSEIKLRDKNEKMIGHSPAFLSVLKQVEQVAATEATVLIQGETGTGKELLAQAIHNLSRRRDSALVKVNCAALPATLIESELFGREKGAYTGAVSQQIGRYEMAHGSTIFLDEISEIAVETQAKLLRVLDQGQFERLGSSRSVEVDVRVIAATNRDLSQAVAEGLFRQDLYYRLNVFPITLPPLRERRDDIPLLTRWFIDEFNKKMGKKITGLSTESLKALETYSWPGNIRELRNVIERAMIRCEGRTLYIDLPHSLEIGLESGPTLMDMEKRYILNVLDKTNWKIRGLDGAAIKLGLKPTTLEARMKRYGLSRP